MKLFRDFRNPRNRKKLCTVLVLCVVINVVSGEVNENGGSGSSDSVKEVGQGRSASSSNLIQTNFGIMKNNTFRMTSKKFGKWASLTSTPSTTSTTSEIPSSTSTRPTQRTTSKPTTTRRSYSTSTTSRSTTTTRGTSTTKREREEITSPVPDYLREAEFEFRKVNNNSASLSSFDFARRLNQQENEDDLMVPDQIMSGSDTFVNVVAPPQSSTSSPSTEATSSASPNEMERRMDQDQEEEDEEEGELLPQPQRQVQFPENFQKFGVQDSLIYKTKEESQTPGAQSRSEPSIEFRQSGGPSVGFTNRRDFGFGGTPRPQPLPPSQHFPTTFQQSGGFGGSRQNQFQNAPPQPTSGGAYTNTNIFAGGLHEINPFSSPSSGSHSHNYPQNSPSNPNVKTFSPYNNLTPRPALTPQRARALNLNYFSSPAPSHAPAASMQQIQQSHHPMPLSFSSSHMESWSPSSFPSHQSTGPVYRGPTRRSDQKQHQHQHHENDIAPSSSRQPEIQGFMPISPFKPSTPHPIDDNSPEVKSNSNGGGDESFLGSFEAGDLPEVADNPQSSPNVVSSSPPPEESTIVPVLRPMSEGNSEQEIDQSPENSPSQLQGFHNEQYEQNENENHHHRNRDSHHHHQDIQNQIHSPPSSSEHENENEHGQEDSPLSRLDFGHLPLNEHNIMPIPENQPQFKPSQIDQFPTTPPSLLSSQLHNSHQSHQQSSPSFASIEESPKSYEYGGFEPSSDPQNSQIHQSHQGFRGFGNFPNGQEQSHHPQGFLGPAQFPGGNDLGFHFTPTSSHYNRNLHQQQQQQQQHQQQNQHQQNQQQSNGFLGFGNPFANQANSVQGFGGPGPSFNSPFLPQPQALQGFGFNDNDNSNGNNGQQNQNQNQNQYNPGTLSPPKGFPAFGPPASNPNPPASSDESSQNIEMEPPQNGGNSLEAPPTSTFHFNNAAENLPSPQAFFSSSISEERSGLPVSSAEVSNESSPGKKRRGQSQSQNQQNAGAPQAPGFQQFGNFPGRNADIILKPDNSKSQSQGQSQPQGNNRFRGSKSLGNGFHELEGSSSTENTVQLPSNTLQLTTSQNSGFSIMSQVQSLGLQQELEIGQSGSMFGATAPASQHSLPDPGFRPHQQDIIANAPQNHNQLGGGHQQFLRGGPVGNVGFNPSNGPSQGILQHQGIGGNQGHGYAAPPPPGPEFNAGGGFSNGGGFGNLGPQNVPIQNNPGPPAPHFNGPPEQGPPPQQGQGFVPGPGFFGPPGAGPGPAASPSGLGGGDHPENHPNPPPNGPLFHPKQPGHGFLGGGKGPLLKGPLHLLRLLLGGGKHGGGIKHSVPIVPAAKPGLGPGPGHGIGPGPGLKLNAGVSADVGVTLNGAGAHLKHGLLDKDKHNLKHKLKLPVVKVVKIVVTLIQKWLDFYAKFSIPKDHYLRVISFAGVYLLFAWLFKDSEHLLHPKCEAWGWGGPEEFTFHAPARFVPAVPVDPKMQQEFLELFRGIEDCHDGKCDKKKKKKKNKKKGKGHKGGHKGHGKDREGRMRSSEEDDEDDEEDDQGSEEDDHSSHEMMDGYQMEINYINDMCPRDQFFYSMSPYHIEAWSTLQRMFTAQKTPADVLHLARALLHSRSVNPKVWYLGLLAASVERPDMTGFALAHPIDAMPDLFVPGHLIDDEFRRYRGLILDRQKRNLIPRKINGTTILVHEKHRSNHYIISSDLRNSTTTTIRPAISSKGTTLTTTSTTTTTPKPVVMEKGRIPSIGGKNETKYGKSIEVDRKQDDDNSEDDSGDDDEEDEEVDGDDSSSDERESRIKKKHPLGYGFGKIGDGYGGYKRGQQGQGQGGQGGLGQGQGGNGLQFQGGHKGDGGDGDDDDKHKHKGKGKGKKKKGKKGKKNKCIIVDGSVGLDNGPENKLWYWREDMMLNQHHAYWHQVYAINATRHGDRRAELFFYMHRSMLARYNAERLSNGFHRTKELGLYPGAIIEEPYDAHIKDFNSGRWWTPRAPHTPMQDILHIHDPDYARDIIVTDVIGLYNKFVKAIKSGKLLTADGKFLPIRFHEGIMPLANTVEASNLSVNPFYYDAFGLHNLGHLLVGLASDPDWSKKLPSGVMSEAAVSMRDPAFYTYHAILDNLFEKFKQTLPPYKPYGGVWPLQWHGVDIVDVKVSSHGGVSEHNSLTTFYIKHKFELEPGVDRSVEKGIEKAQICAVHLDHAPFQFQITIDRKKCAKSKTGQGTVRIFMAPRYNEEGDRLSYAEQRRLMFQMDAFQVDLHVGRNIITRNSRDNQLTHPWTRSLKDYERGPDPSGAADFCGCGWPHHLFIPKGNTKGMPFDVFVMVTNFDEDAVVDHPLDLEIPETCNSPYIFCGRPRRRYPDARPMGYPFDRPGYHVPAKSCGSGFTIKDLLCKIAGKIFTRPVATLEEYVSGASNMAMTVVEIKHIPKVIGKHHG